MPKGLTNVLVPFGAGMDQKTDARALGPGQWTSITNGAFTKRGRLTSRNGYGSFGKTILNGGGLNVTAPVQKLATYKSESDLIDANGVLYSSAPSANAWSQMGQLPEATATRQNFFDAVYSQQSPDIASVGSYTIRCWLANVSGSFPNLVGDLYAAVYDSASDSIISPPTKLVSGTAGAPRVQIIGTVGAIAYWDNSASRLRVAYCALATSPPQWTAGVNLVTDCNAAIFDWISLGDRFCVTYQTTTTTVLAVNTFTTGFASINRITITDANATSMYAMSLAWTGSAVLLAYTASGAAASAATASYTNSLSTNYAPTQLPSGILYGAGGMGIPYQFGIAYCGANRAMVVAFGGSTSSNSGMYTIGVNTSTGASVGAVTFTPGVQILSRPFNWGTNAYVTGYWYFDRLASKSTIQGTAWLLAIGGQAGPTQARVVCTVGPRQVPPSWNTYNRVPCALSNVIGSGNSFATIASVVADGVYPSGRTSMMQVTYTFRDPNAFSTAVAGESLAIATGAPSTYDGVNPVEIGFPVYPESITTATSNSGGSLNQNASYQYQITYEFIDAKGQRHISAPSPAVTVTTPAGASGNSITVTITAPCLPLTMKQTATNGVKVSLVVYRTLAGGTTFYRVTNDDVPSSNYNVIGQSSVTITDTASDSSIASNPLLYTTGGVLPNMCPPSAQFALTHKGRLWLAGTDEGKAVWYSKYVTTGFAPGFNDALILYFPEGDRVTGLASMDDKLVVFKNDRIYIVQGDGPNDTGFGSEFGVQTISTDVGCTSADSIVFTPDGIMFQSSKGLMLLSRALEVEYIGAPVEDTVNSYPVCTAAVLVPKYDEVRFALQNSAGSSGTWAVYNYLQKRWSTWTIKESDNAGATAVPGAAVLWSGTYYWAGSTGMVYSESTSDYDGSPAWPITVSATSGWIKTGGIAGFQRMRRLQLVTDSADSCATTVTVYNDYSSTPSATYAFGQGINQAEAILKVQKCEAVQFTVSCAPNATSSQVQIVGLQLECVTDTRLNPTPAGSRL